MTTHNKNKIIAAAKEVGAQMRVYKTSPGQDHFLLETEQLERFWQIAFKAGRQAERESVNLDDGTIDWRGENEV